MAIDAVVGTGSVVGFTPNGVADTNELLHTMDRNGHARHLFEGQRFEAEHLRDAIEDTTVAVEKIGAAGQLTAEKIGAANLLATERVGTATQLAAERMSAASALAAYQNFAAIQLQASQNHATAMAQSAECCSSTKELIREDGQKTRDLINQIERDRQAIALADLKQELTIARLGGTVAAMRT